MSQMLEETIREIDNVMDSVDIIGATIADRANQFKWGTKKLSLMVAYDMCIKAYNALESARISTYLATKNINRAQIEISNAYKEICYAKRFIDYAIFCLENYGTEREPIDKLEKAFNKIVDIQKMLDKLLKE